MNVIWRLWVVVAVIFCVINEESILGHGTVPPRQQKSYKERIANMFRYAYENYLHYAYPYDELRPLSCDGIDTWGKFSLTLIDALDTLAVMGNYTEFRRISELVSHNIDFDINVNVSVFETNIRVVGGLLSAHLLSRRAGVDVESGWPCSGPLLRLAENVALRILPAFKTNTGMPYGTVNLRHGVPPGETTVTCTAGVATFIVEFGTLSRLTGNPVFEEVAMTAIRHLWKVKSSIGLVGNHIDVQTGKWTAADSGIGAGVDSYFEYLVKGAILLQKPELMNMFEEYKSVITKYNKHDDWYLWVGMTHGKISLPIFQSLEAFWPGLLSLVGDLDQAIKTMHNYHQVWKQYGFTPEYYNIIQGEVYGSREEYPLRPELIESAFYLHRATNDPFFLQIGMEMVEAIEHSAKTPCGYATIKDVHSHSVEDRMESFFLAETTKYLYLLFDEDNFISKHYKPGLSGHKVETSHGECIVEAGGYVFNTEAHPIDISAVHCCSIQHKNDVGKLREANEQTDVFDAYFARESARNSFRTTFRKRYDPVVTRYPPDDDIPNAKSSTTNTQGGNSSDDVGDSSDIEMSPTESAHPIQTVTIPTKLDGFSTAKTNDNKSGESASNTQGDSITVNKTFESRYDRLMCSAQPFLLRLSIMGQMFYVT